jgi:hypothetical protein
VLKSHAMKMYKRLGVKAPFIQDFCIIKVILQLTFYQALSRGIEPLLGFKTGL